MSDADRTGAAPVTSRERVGELDVLRGFALLGVLLVHFATWPAAPVLATDAEWAALTAASSLLPPQTPADRRPVQGNHAMRLSIEIPQRSGASFATAQASAIVGID